MVKKRAKNEKLPARRAGSGPAPTKLLRDLRDLIQSTRTGLAQAVNSALVLLYWQVGQRIRSDVLKSRRATYGDETYSTPSNELAVEFGNGYSRPNLTRMIRFAEVFPAREVVVTLSRCLGWSHFVEIIYLKDQLLPSRHMSDLVHSVDTCLGGATYGRSKPGPRSRRETGVQDPRCSLHHRDSARTELFSLRGRGSSRRRQRGLLSLPLLRESSGSAGKDHSHRCRR